MGDDASRRPSCANDAKALTSLARRSAEGFAVEWRLELESMPDKSWDRYAYTSLRTGSMLVLTTEDMGEIVDM